jgi:hypothetical protein
VDFYVILDELQKEASALSGSGADSRDCLFPGSCECLYRMGSNENGYIKYIVDYAGFSHVFF